MVLFGIGFLVCRSNRAGIFSGLNSRDVDIPLCRMLFFYQEMQLLFSPDKHLSGNLASKGLFYCKN